jgi:hypothetical protein
MPGQDWEYTVLQMATTGRSTHLAERLNQMAEDGFEPFMSSGDDTVTIILRRPKQAKAGGAAEPTQ